MRRTKKKLNAPATKRSRKSRGVPARPTYRFCLFVSGATSKSARAIQNIKAICDKHLQEHHQVDVVDVYQQPRRSGTEHLAALPTLIKEYPLPVRKIIGDLSNTERVLSGLNLKMRR